MIRADLPALVLAPMEGITDAPMRAFMGEIGGFSYAVSEFLRVSGEVIPAKVFRRDVPELGTNGKTPTGLPVQVQILGGNPERMAESALAAVAAGATAIDINFGCPAPIVNRHDGGASLLQHPCRIREIVSAVRGAVPQEVPVSAKLRLGWESIDDIDKNAAMAVEGGVSWITIHARTRAQGYAPPVYWEPVRRAQEQLPVPVIANGDIGTMEEFEKCREETGCIHFMIGRGALADPTLPRRIANELGIGPFNIEKQDWMQTFRKFESYMDKAGITKPKVTLMRLKQWMKIANGRATFPYFHDLKQCESVDEFFNQLEDLSNPKLAKIAG